MKDVGDIIAPPPDFDRNPFPGRVPTWIFVAVIVALVAYIVFALIQSVN